MKQLVKKFSLIALGMDLKRKNVLKITNANLVKKNFAKVDIMIIMMIIINNALFIWTRIYV
jgi:hypothetical protein